MKVKEFIKIIKYPEDYLFNIYKNEGYALIGADIDELLAKYGNETIQINSLLISGNNIEIEL